MSSKLLVMGIIVAAGVVTIIGCSKKPDSGEAEAPGMGERTGAALDRGAEKTGDAVKGAAVATKKVAGKVVEKTGEVMEKSGAAVEDTGADMQK